MSDDAEMMQRMMAPMMNMFAATEISKIADEFAKTAMQCLLDARPEIAAEPENLASVSYAIAKAMMHAREMAFHSRGVPAAVCPRNPNHHGVDGRWFDLEAGITIGEAEECPCGGTGPA